MVDGVVGVVISLGAYVLMSVSVQDWSQLFTLLCFFVTIFMITSFLWYIAGQAFALSPYDGRLFGLSILLVALLAPLPFSARLVLFSEIKELAATLLLINTGVVFVLTALINMLVLHKPESHKAPRPVLGDLQAQKFGLPAGSITAFLFLLAPSEETLGGPFVGLNLPVSTLGFLFSFVVFFLVIAAAEPLVRRRLPVSMDESQEVRLMGRVFHSKMRGVNNALFQMALGLSVFSLIDLPVETVSDLLPPLIHFAYLFLLIVVFWNELFKVYAVIPIWEEGIDFLTNMVAFFAVMIPPAFRFVVLPGPETQTIGATFFAILMAGLATMNAILYLYAARLKHHEAKISSGIAREFRGWAAGSLILALVFLATLSVPFETTTFWGISIRVFVWWVSLASFVVLMRIVSR